MLAEPEKTVFTGIPLLINSSSQERRTSSVPEPRTLPISQILTSSPSMTASKREYEFGKSITTRSHPSKTKGRKVVPISGCFFTFTRTPSERIRALRKMSFLVIFLFSVMVNFLRTQIFLFFRIEIGKSLI